MKLTRFGKAARLHRLQTNQRLKDMAAELGVSSSMLSAVETGTKSFPEDWLDDLPGHLVQAHIDDVVAAIDAGVASLIDRRDRLINRYGHASASPPKTPRKTSETVR